MSNLEDRVRGVIEAEGLLPRGGSVLVAVSGGADSVALLCVLHRLGYRCVVAHCNFHLRGDESERDERFVATLCEAMSVPILRKDFDVEKRMRWHGESMEMACRSLRYEWFDELLETEDIPSVAVGHHYEDNIETFLINLFRGTGLSGLTGMKVQSGKVIRPLLGVKREEIEGYLRGQGIEWVNDSSNASDDFVRNRIRNRIVPLIRELFPSGIGGIDLTMRNLKEYKLIVDSAIGFCERKHRSRSDEVNLRELGKLEEAGLVLYEMLRGEGFSRRQVDDMLRAGMNNTGATFSAGANVREVDHGMLRAKYSYWRLIDESFPVNLSDDVTEPICIKVSRHDISEFSPSLDHAVLYLDEVAVREEHTWELRRHRRGDRIIPFGKKRSKLVSDLMGEARYSAKEKRDAWLLTCDGRIVWIVGLRPSALYTINETTKHYIKLEYISV